MKGKSTTDAIFAVRQLQGKYTEGQRQLHGVFIDLEKAYDRVPREELYWCMCATNVPEKYIRIVQDMYHESETVARCISKMTEPFQVRVGLHQGSALTPFLFAIIMDTLTEDIRKEAPWSMLFADDVVLGSVDKETLEEDLGKWRDALEKRGMRMSRSKTEYMCLNGKSNGSVTMQDQPLPEATEFKHLGSMLTTDGRVEAEINRRIQARWNNWRKMSGFLCDKKIPPKVKGKIHQTVVQPAMLYGLETVPQTKKATQKLEVAEMKMCRWASSMWCDKKRLDTK